MQHFLEQFSIVYMGVQQHIEVETELSRIYDTESDGQARLYLEAGCCTRRKHKIGISREKNGDETYDNFSCLGGIVLAMVAWMGYNYLRRRATKIVDNAEFENLIRKNER